MSPFYWLAFISKSRYPQSVLSVVTGPPKDICSMREMTPNLPVVFIFVLKPLCLQSHSSGMIILQFLLLSQHQHVKWTRWSSFLKDLHKLKVKYSNDRCLTFARKIHGLTVVAVCSRQYLHINKHSLPLAPTTPFPCY